MRTRFDAFKNIFDNNLWQSTGTVSGPASELENTSKLRSYLQELLKKYEIKSIVDAGCGDFVWMKEIDLSGIWYLGVDIVPTIVRNNNKRYATDLIKFIQHDLVDFNFPKVDLIILRDVLIHLPLEDCAKVLENVYDSGSTYLLSTSVPSVATNYNKWGGDIPPGDFITRNLTLEPLCMPEPTEVYWEEIYSHIRALSLWKL